LSASGGQRERGQVLRLPLAIRDELGYTWARVVVTVPPDDNARGGAPTALGAEFKTPELMTFLPYFPVSFRAPYRKPTASRAAMVGRR
jgi:hypothetical protein